MNETEEARRNAVAYEMLGHLERWAPFGGGDDEIFLTFGVSPSVFYSRVAQYLRSDPGLGAERDVDRLIAYCIRKSRAADGRQGS